jgi:micrococcal nuclease
MCNVGCVTPERRRTVPAMRRIAPFALLLAVVAVLVARGGDDEPRDSGRAQVVRVVDGDTVVLSGLGKARLIGVDTPEVHGRSECYGPQASRFARRALAHQRVRYRLGAEPRDRYGRSLVYLWLEDGRFFNAVLIGQGYATPLTIPPNVAHAHELAQLARDARRAGKGVWSACRMG